MFGCVGLGGYEQHRMLTAIRRREVGKRFGSSFSKFYCPKVHS